MKKLFILLGLLLFCPQLAFAQNSQRNPCFYPTPTSTNCTPVSTTTPLPVTGGGGGGGTSSAFGAAFPSTGTAIGYLDGTNMVAGRVTSSALADGFTPPTSGLQQIQSFGYVWNGTTWNRLTASSGGLSVQDQAAFTAGTSNFTPGGGVFNDAATLTSGQQGEYRLTTKRAQVVDVDTTGNALYSAITAPIPTGTNIIGKIGIDQTTPGTTNGVVINSGTVASLSTNVNVPLAPTIAASSHIAGSSIGGLQTFNFFRASSTFSGIVNNVKWTWKTAGAGFPVTVYLFSANPTASTCTDATTLSLNAADVPKLIAGSPFTLTPAVIGSGSTIASAYSQGAISVQNADGTPGRSLYACVVANAPVTPAANDGLLTVAGVTD